MDKLLATSPTEYVHQHVELAYASTAYGAQGQTVDTAHIAIGEHTSAAGAYVAMTRGRQHNTAHIVAESVMDARSQWTAVFARDGADLGPTHASWMAGQAIDQFGPALGRPPTPPRPYGWEPEPAMHRPYAAFSPMSACALVGEVPARGKVPRSSAFSC